MYFIIKINIDDKGLFVSSDMVSHTNAGIISAQQLLLKETKAYVAELAGIVVADGIKIIDIHSFNQVNEPIIDSVLVYRLELDPHRLHIYQRQSKITSGLIYGKAITTEFRKIKIFELVEYTNLILEVGNFESNTKTKKQIDMVPHGPANIKVPKTLTISPMCDLISSLKSSPMFKKKYSESESVSNSPCGIMLRSEIIPLWECRGSFPPEEGKNSRTKPQEYYVYKQLNFHLLEQHRMHFDDTQFLYVPNHNMMYL